MNDAEALAAAKHKLAATAARLRAIDELNVGKLIEGRGIDQPQKLRNRLRSVIESLEEP